MYDEHQARSKTGGVCVEKKRGHKGCSPMGGPSKADTYDWASFVRSRGEMGICIERRSPAPRPDSKLASSQMGLWPLHGLPP